MLRVKHLMFFTRFNLDDAEYGKHVAAVLGMLVPLALSAIFLMTDLFRTALLLGFVGICYGAVAALISTYDLISTLIAVYRGKKTLGFFLKHLSISLAIATCSIAIICGIGRWLVVLASI